MTRYRTDYSEDDGKTVIIDEGLTRTEAMQKAAILSRKHGTAYAVASDDKGRDTGQRVYVNGRFDYQDDQF